MTRTAALSLTLLLALAVTPAAADDTIPPPHHDQATFATHAYDPMPTISITFPQENDVVPAGEPLMLKVDLRDLVLGDKAFHVHVWVDDQPYKAMYDATVPFEIKDLAPGTHSIRVAPSRPWHELFKNPGAFAAVNFHVGDSDVVHSYINHDLPTLTYSRPKKNLTHTWADSRNLIFDWYVTNVTLGEDGVYLRMTVCDKVYLLTSWSPIFFENPPAGEYSVTLELMKNGELLEANFNPFTANFTISPEATNTAPPADPHGAH